MTEEANILIEEAGCSRRVAEKILSLYENNLNLAFNWVASKHRNIVIFKVKFATKSTYSSGLLFLSLNPSAQKLLRTAVTISQNPYVYYTDISQPWRKFENLIYTHRFGEDIIHEKNILAAQRLRAFFQDEGNGHFYRIFNGVDKIEIRNILGGILRKVLDEDIFFDFSKERVTLLEWRGAKSGEVMPSPRVGSRQTPVELRMEVVKGKKLFFFHKSSKLAGNLRQGDFVLAKIVDDREIAHYLLRLIGVSKTDEISAEIEKIEKYGNGYRLIFQLGGMAKGVAYVPSGTIVKIPKKIDSIFRLM